MVRTNIDTPQTTTPENTLSETSTQERDKFLAVINSRWNDFDKETLKKASGIVLMRNLNPDFQNAKEQYTESVKILGSIKSDKELQENPAVMKKLNEINHFLGVYLASSARNEAYDEVLRKMKGDIEEFRQTIGQKASPSSPPDVQTLAAAEKPAGKNEASGGGGGASHEGTPSSGETGATGSEVALGAAATGALGSAMGEVQHEFKSTAEKWMKNPVVSVLGLFGIDKQSIVSDYKAALEAKKSEDFGDRLMGGFKAVLFSFFAKLLGVDLDKAMKGEGSQVEAGAADPKPQVNEQEKAKEIVKEAFDDKAYKITSMYLINRVTEPPYNGFWSAVYAGLKDTTYGKSDVEKQENIKKTAGDSYAWKELKDKNIGDLMNLNGKTPEAIAESLGLQDKSQQNKYAVTYAIASLAKNRKFIEKHFSERVPNWQQIPLHTFIEQFGKYMGLSTLDTITTAIGNVDWKNDAGKAKDVFQKMFLAIGDNGESSGILGEKMNVMKEKGVDEEVMLRILGPSETDGENPVSGYSSLLNSKPYENEVTNQKMKELVGENGFKKTVVSLMNQIGLGKYTADLENGNKLQMSELLTVFLLTEGKTNMDQLTPGEQMPLIAYLYSIAGRTHPGKFTADSFLTMLDGSDNKYVETVSEIFGKTISKATYTAVCTAIGIANQTFEAFWAIKDTHPKIFVGVILGIVGSGIAAWRLRAPIATTAFATGIMVAGVKVAGLSGVSK